MKNCNVYFKLNCTCEQEGYCYDSEDGCIYAKDKEECLKCKSTNILDCYECKVEKEGINYEIKML